MRRVRLILVSPMHAANVGAVARLCGNFAIDDVVLVNPRCDVSSPEAHALATQHAQHILQSFRVSDSFRETLNGGDVALGFTRRLGDMRRPDVSWKDLSQFLKLDGRVDLVFGPEDTGLSQSDLTLCTHLCSLPTHSDVPSLNLSQAVAVVLSGLLWTSMEELEHKPIVKTRFEAERPISTEGFLSLIEHWKLVMIELGLVHDGNPDRLLHYYQRVLSRAGISEREGNMFRGFLSQIQLKLGTRMTKKAKRDV